MTQSTASRSANVALDTRYRVRFDEAGADGRVHPAVLLAWAQDAAWLHSTALGFGRDWYTQRRLTWLVRAAELRLVDPPSSGDEVAVRTEIVGFRRVLARRLTTVRSTDGRELARSLTDWTLTDGRGRPTRIPDVFTSLADVPSFAPLTVPPPPPEAVAADEVAIVVRARDVDPLAHANNAAVLTYVDEALSAVDEAEVARRRPSVYRLVYLRPAALGARLTVLVRSAGARRWLDLRSPDALVAAAVVELADERDRPARRPSRTEAQTGHDRSSVRTHAPARVEDVMGPSPTASAVPRRVASVARPTGVGRALATYEIPIEGRDEWLAAARHLA